MLYHRKGEALIKRRRDPSPTTEIHGDFTLTYRPLSTLRGGLVGDTETQYFNPETKRSERAGNPVMFPESRFQANVVSITDTSSGVQVAVEWDQQSAHRRVKVLQEQAAERLRRSSNPKPERLYRAD